MPTCQEECAGRRAAAAALALLRSESSAPRDVCLTMGVAGGKADQTSLLSIALALRWGPAQRFSPTS
ncbi:Hypothetical predicted protein [Podarcis lilfordi]|uniref:Uncharacterized protein n=1 Tax=Podarcis lilfordi TaxID=74358 RepID=A0AA35KN90_9SAUR|nr:Hypothetical predicted protein [Podarcis lilfordi]